MAKTYIINDAYGVLCRDYYLRFPEEPISASTIAPVEVPKLVDETSLDTVLSAIVKGNHKSSDDIIITAHGNENGIIFGLFHNSPKKAVTANLRVLMDNQSREKKAELLSIRPDLVDQLIAKVEVVRKIGLGHVAFRGCMIGQRIGNLTTLRDLLGAKVVSGTTLLSTYGYGRPEYISNRKKFDDLVKRYATTASIYDGKARVILATAPKKNFTEIVFFYLESKDVMLEWLQANIREAATSADATAVQVKTPLHWLTRKPPVMPLDGVSKKTARPLGYADFIRTSEDAP
jgi:hypothetical protein